MFTLVFGAVSGLFHKWDSACIDNHIFRLHYRATVIILLAATALVSRECHCDLMESGCDATMSHITNMYRLSND